MVVKESHKSAVQIIASPFTGVLASVQPTGDLRGSGEHTLVAERGRFSPVKLPDNQGDKE